MPKPPREPPMPPREDKLAALNAALLEADKGVLISSEAVEAWMDSWGTENELPLPEPDVFPERKL